MAYLPAGEEDGDYSDEWSLDEDDPPSNNVPQRSEPERTLNNYNRNNSYSNNNGRKNGSLPQPLFSRNVPNREEPSSKFSSSERTPWVPNFAAFPASSFLTAEDYQRAAVRGNLNVIERCLEQGICVDEALRHGWTALMFAGNYVQVEAVGLLLKHGANPKHAVDMYCPLMASCNACSGMDEQVGECVSLLVEAGADVNAKDRHHTTSLMLACREGHVSAVRQLLRLGAAVNAQDSKGWTALTWATQRQRKAIVVELLDAGADCNIQHLDKLTVKDLAAHLPSDEMLALLERRPANIVNSSGDTVIETAKMSATTGQLPAELSHCTLDSGEAQAKLTDLRYGELEVFLIGLDLPHLVRVFQQQLIDLNLLLTLTEQDLISAGVSQVGARKKILDAVQTIHKKDWEPSCLVSIHYNKRITCADAVAMVANSSKHVRYIASTMMYVKGQLRKHPDSITQSTDRVSPAQLLRHAEDAARNAATLQQELRTIQRELRLEMARRNCKPPDLIEQTDKRSRLLSVTSLTAATLAVTLSAVLYLNRETVSEFVSSVVPDFLTRHR
ncbi:ankyrin repeat, SAM and basic leucine zipper domain-containing protein 1 [Aplysia californica]|uniref:Ankyrin repeat, SAM and basic leucine zipper domain-containing protein 1 n=1 Tax=Aplysia californica TaxID=6500 RepID=A0ABM0JSN9_APLCA|nr:ankyrin repeat, SAM and basic leucine zipper domain-containing protein 1 [Aplysia californica]